MKKRLKLTVILKFKILLESYFGLRSVSRIWLEKVRKHEEKY